ncbi:hypothetical protein JTE90_011432 [Oedothorax gibbosus]|uniref:BTB domain-containing protein n=1 Tax=Oedothorax gibbosus TaxID=931172 RepID=A0AAV6VB04_9ARAC|nr:hypothetical protein JTE90_011432 [Oedothorax gibbosus]
MSCADEEGCFTLTWKIENVDIFLRAEDGRLSSPAWKTETTEGKAVEWQVLADHDGPSIRIRLICLNETWNPDRCVLTVISSCGKILSKSPEFIAFQSVKFWIYKKDMFVNKMQSNIYLNCLTVECKMWRNSMKSGGFRINSVVKKVLFCWCIEDPLFLSPCSSPFSHNKIIEKDNVRISMRLDSKGVNDEYLIALALTIIDGCFSFVYCNFVCDCIMAKKTRNCTSIKYNDLRTEYKEWRIVKIGVTRNASYKFNLQLDTIVAHHNNSQCQITHSTSSAIAKIGGSFETVNDPLRIDLLQLYRDGTFSDATINTDGKSFSAHRSILAARSPVFRAMFEKDEMSEGRSGVVKIDDVDSETVDRMLVFLYGDSLQGLEWGEAASLYLILNF